MEKISGLASSLTGSATSSGTGSKAANATASTEVGAVPSSAAMHQAKAAGQGLGAMKAEAQAAAAFSQGDYMGAASHAVEAVERRVLQGGEGLGAVTRGLVGGSSVKPADTVNPSFVQHPSSTGSSSQQGQSRS
jgi:hypothetical protein